jgi:hypothetical protein
VGGGVLSAIDLAARSRALQLPKIDEASDWVRIEVLGRITELLVIVH